MTVISSVVAVFEAILTWLTGALTATSEIFYSSEGGLTIIGVIVLMTFAIGVCTLVLGWLRSLFHGRG